MRRICVNITAEIHIMKFPILIVSLLHKSQPVRRVPAAANQFAIAHFLVLNLTIGS